MELELSLYNRAKLNLDSSDVNNNPIGFYSYATEVISGGKKKQGEPFTLLDTGTFLGNLYSRVENDTIFFGTKDPKKEEVLENLLSKDIFGLTNQDLRKAIDERILPFFLQYLRQELF